MVVDTVAGDVRLTNSYGSMNLKNIGGNAVVKSLHGSVKGTNLFDGERDDRLTAEITVSYGKVRLNFPSTLSAEISAQTSYGEISSAFPLRDDLLSSSGKSHLVGTIGEGKHRLTISGKHSSVNIGRE